MKVLITNDDGVHSQGIIQLAKEIRDHCESIFVIAPSVNQSGVSSALTFLRPLFPTALGGPADSQDDGIPGYSLDGTPVDCVRLGLHELCPFQPDIVLSGINEGLNAGQNVNYSGTVGGAMAAASFGVPSMAISLEASHTNKFSEAARIAWKVVQASRQIKLPSQTFLNLNIPTIACDKAVEVVVVPTELNPMGYAFQRGTDPKNRNYYWATNSPAPQASEHLTDTEALRQGKITISLLSANLNCQPSYQLDSLAAFQAIQQIEE